MLQVQCICFSQMYVLREITAAKNECINEASPTKFCQSKGEFTVTDCESVDNWK